MLHSSILYRLQIFMVLLALVLQPQLSTTFLASSGTDNAARAAANRASADSPAIQGPRVAIANPSNYDMLHHGSPSTPWTAFAARGVNTVFGSFVAQSSDLVIQGRGLAITFVRTYNSANQADGPLGIGWTHSFNAAILEQTADSVTVRSPDGRLDLYMRQPDGSYDAPPGIFNALDKKPDGRFELKLKDQTTYHFDAPGKLARVEDRNGNAITLAYSNNNLTSLTDTVGRPFVLTYDSHHHLTKVTDPSSRELTFTYDAAGLLVSSKDLSSKTTTYTYDASQRLTSVVDANNQAVVQNTYDGDGRVVQQKDALNHATAISYQPTSGLTTLTDPRSAATVYAYDPGYRVTSIRDAFDKSVVLTYDASNNRTGITDRRGHMTSLVYDSRGNVTQATDRANSVSHYTYDDRNNLLSATDARGHQTTLTYDARGNVLAMVDAEGNRTGFAFDAHGQPTAITDGNGNITTPEYDTQGNATAIRDAFNSITQFGYDAIGRMIGMSDANGGAYTLVYDLSDRPTEVSDTAGGITHYTYDAVGNLLSVLDANNHATQMAYDARSQLVTVTDAAGDNTHYTYDANGNRIGVMDANNQTTTSTYDPLNRLVAVTDPLGRTTEYGYDANGNRTVMTDTMGAATVFVYDASDRLISTTDTLGHTTTMAYDATGNLVEQSDALGRVTRYGYDGLGRLTSVTDPANNTVRYYYDRVGNRTEVVDAKNAATHYVYDRVNRLVLTEDPLGNRTEYTYDRLGNLVEKTDPNGQTTTYLYDAMNRLIQAKYPDNTLSYDYDAVGNRTHVIDIQGVTLYEYDALNRISRVTNPASQSIGYTYDALGRRTSLIYPDNRAVSYTYDEASRLIGVRDWDNQATQYTYTDRGQLSLIDYPNGASASYTYDDAGRLTDIVHRDAADQVILPIHYSLDGNGNRTAMTDDRGTEQYTYDALDRLTQVAYADGETVGYTYDAAGNRLSMQSSVHGTTTYSYDEGDRLLQMVNPDSTVTGFTYDANGNMTRKGDTQYLFDSANRLTQVIDGEDVVLFTYDGDGHRLTKVVNGVKSQYATDLASALPQVLTETRDGQTTAYTHGGGLVGISEPGLGWRYFQTDGLNSVRGLSAESGHTATSYDYDVFGSRRHTSGNSQNVFSFTGQQLDLETNLIYLRARYYEPAIGRFINRDSVSGFERISQQWNRYTYVENNPISRFDPTGKSSECFDPYGDLCLSPINGTAANIGPDLSIPDYQTHDTPYWTEERIASLFFDLVGCVPWLNVIGDVHLDDGYFIVSIGDELYRNGLSREAVEEFLWWGIGKGWQLAGNVIPVLGAAQCLANVGWDLRPPKSETPPGLPVDCLLGTGPCAMSEDVPTGTDTDTTGNASTQWLPSQSSTSAGPISQITSTEAQTQIEAPATDSALKSARIQIRAKSTGAVVKVSFHAYYATNPTDITTVAWHDLGWAQRVGDTWVLDWDLATVPDQGNAGWGTVAISAHYYTCGDPANPSCEHVGDQVRVDIDRGPLTWDFADDSLGWTLVNGDHAGFDGRAWKFEPGNDPQAVSPAMAEDASKYNAVEVVMDSTASSHAGRIYFTTQASPGYSEDKSVGYTLVPNGDYRAYFVYMGANPNWQGIITGLRVDPVMDGDPDSGSDYVFLDKISFRQLDGASRTTWVPDGSLVRNADETIYLIEQVGGVSVKRPFSRADVFLSCGYDWNKILYLSETQIASYNDGALMTACTGAILKGSGPTVYFVENGAKRPFCSGEVYTEMGYRWESVRSMADGTLAEIPNGPPLCTGWTRHPDGSLVKTASSATTYLLQDGARRALTHESVLSSWGRSMDDIVTIGDAELAGYPPGADLLLRDGSLVKGDDPTVYVVERAKRRPFALAADFEAFGYRWENVQTVPNAVRDQLPVGARCAPDPLVVTTGLTVAPDWPAVGQITTAAFTVQNSGNKPVALQGLRAEVPTAGTFPEQTAATLQPGQSAPYSQGRSFSATGTYQARAQVQLNGQWQATLPDAGQSVEAGFTVMMIAAPVLNPIQNSDQDGTYQVSWSAVSGATLYRLLEDDDPNFGSPQVVYEASGTSWSVTGHVAGSFHYRVKVMLPHESGLSGPQSVIVQGTPVYHGWHPDGTLLQRAGGSEVMLLENGRRRRFPNASIYFSHYPTWDPVGIVQPIEYDQYQEGDWMTFRTGTILKDQANAAVYAIENNAKRGFCTDDTFLALGLSWNAIQQVPTADLPTANGAIICLSTLRFNLGLVKDAANSTVYRLENGQKRPFTSGNGFISHGYDYSRIATIDDAELAGWPTGAQLPLRNGTIIKCDGAGCSNPSALSVMENGLRREFTSWDEYVGQGYQNVVAMALPAAEYNAISVGTPVGPNSGYVEDAFVKYDNSSLVYRVQGGQKRPVNYEAILRSYGYGSQEGKIFIAEVNSANHWRLNQLPTGSALQFRDGTLISKSSSDAIYVVAGGLRRWIASDQALQALGYDRSDVMVVDPALVDSLADGPYIALKSLLVEGSRVRKSDGTMYLIQNGTKRGFYSWEVYRSWGYDSSDHAELATSELDLYPNGALMAFRDGTLLKEPSNPTVYVVEHQLKRPFPSVAVMQEYGYQEADIQVVPDGQLNWIATGPMMETGSPTPLSAVINDGAQYTTSPDVTVRVHATDFSSGVRYVELSNDNWAHTTRKDLPPAEGNFIRDIYPWNLTTDSPGDGLKKVWVKFCDAQNYCTANNALQPAEIILNTAPPSGAYTAPAAGQVVRDQVVLAVSVTDNGSGIQYVEFKAQYGGAWHTLHKDYVAPYQFTWDVTAVPDAGDITLGGNMVDNMGRSGTIATRTISKDRTPPASTGLVAAAGEPTEALVRPDSIRASSEFVRDTVTLAIDAADNLSGVGTVQFSGYYAGAWHVVGSDSSAPYAIVWNLAVVSDGPVSAKASVPDVAGNSQELPALQVVKDTVPPAKASAIVLADRSGVFTNDTTPEFAWAAATDERSGIDGYYLAIDDWTPDGGGALDWAIANVTTWSPPTSLAEGEHWVALTSRDRAGNVNPSDTNLPGDAPYLQFTIDLVLPTSAVEPLAAQQMDIQFPVAWSGLDDVAGVAAYDIQFREGNGPWLNWLVGTMETQAIFHGEHSREYAFRVRAHDGAGNVEPYPATPDTTTSTPSLPPTPTPTATPTMPPTPTATPSVTPSPTATPSVTPSPTATSIPPDATILYIAPVQATGYVGTPITLTVSITNVHGLGSFEFTLNYDPALVTVEAVTLGAFPGSTGRVFSPTGPIINNTTGTTTYGAFSLGATPPGPDGSGVLAQVRLTPHVAGDAPLHLSSVQVSNVQGVSIPVVSQDGILHVIACLGDFDGDGDVDIVDVQRVAYRWNSHCNDPLYDALYDTDGDCDIDILDVQRIAYRWGTVCTAESSWGNSSTTPRRTLLAQPAILSIQPISDTVAAGTVFTMTAAISDVTELGAFEFTLNYDPALIAGQSVVLGAFPTSTGRTFIPTGPAINNTTGTLTFGAFSLGASPPGASGDGALALIRLQARTVGSTALEFSSAQVANVAGIPVSVTLQGGNRVIIPCLGDVNGDGEVDIFDIQATASRWNINVGAPGYDPRYNLDGDGNIDVVDVQTVAGRWGTVCHLVR